MSEPTIEHPAIENTGRGPLSTDELAAVIGHDIPAGSYVNLGIGQPTKIADHLPVDDDGNPTVILHTENGMLGMGPAADGRSDRPRPHQRRQGPGDRTARRGVLPPRRLLRDDARRPPRRLRSRRLPGRGQRRPRQLAHRQAGRHPGRRRRHGPGDRRQGRLRDDDALHQEGRAKLVQTCTYPLTGVACVSRVYTDYAVFDIQPDGVHVLATYGITLADLRDRVNVKLLG